MRYSRAVVDGATTHAAAVQRFVAHQRIDVSGVLPTDAGVIGSDVAALMHGDRCVALAAIAPCRMTNIGHFPPVSTQPCNGLAPTCDGSSRPLLPCSLVPFPFPLGGAGMAPWAHPILIQVPLPLPRGGVAVSPWAPPMTEVMIT